MELQVEEGGRTSHDQVGNLDYPLKKRGSLEVFKQGETRLCDTVESGHNGKPRLGEGASRGREAAATVVGGRGQ